MAWSTSELADLAGTTVNTIRHYHRLGLLAEPDRRYNGYKKYGVPHLVRLLRIRRLAELGVPLSEVDRVADSAGTADRLREVDADLAAKIEQLQQARGEIAAILSNNAPPDVPAGFASVAEHLSEVDRSVIHIYSKLYDERALADLRDIVEEDAELGDDGKEFEALPPDADEPTRQRLAEQIAPNIARNLVDYPWLSDPATHQAKSGRVVQETFIEAVTELYNSAQRDVLTRAALLGYQIAQEVLAARDDADGTGSPPTP
ncbi:MerR family transcriptional regulator [Cellulomonas dongxiuzhuiae]|uniref:MerR family transcriptional regulator n=1 Tax=Cellulomonas dongxiuzhuiae TaxID=2819979 RepID=A0ABX8GKT7_9CELL|nr:MerR family transcriptional regulator [Cellulomonas dongxiuzhuiae]MBO3089645.1 MerR family transcriptional regulator [Cellulomonas dongxiuzhuiae]MBO3095282.1 MerR family transcriptional regulator [Cellulomonas dongxiuzhuiae]QWC16276.1 MerR family transcriptional regulator [Cellulomonas dongxiuzhuiae]